MLLELIGIACAYKAANRYNDLYEEEQEKNEELKRLEIMNKKLELLNNIHKLRNELGM